MNIAVFHHTDFDGYGAAAVVYNSHLIKEDEFESISFIPVNYNDKLVKCDRIDEFDEDDDTNIIYIVDLSLTTLDSLKEVQKMISKYNCKVVYIDHHVTSIEAWKDYINYPELSVLREAEESGQLEKILDINRSGAWLAYDHLIGNDYPDIITYIDDYDRWVHNYPESKMANTAFYASTNLTDPTDGVWSDMLADDTETEGFVEKGRAIIEYVASNNKRYRDSYMYQSTITDENGKTYPCAVLSYKTNSDVFGTAYDEYPIVVAWAFDGERFVYSLYSNLKDPNINCAAIAKMYGGGGHTGAAGFTSDTLLFKGSLKLKGF